MSVRYAVTAQASRTCAPPDLHRRRLVKGGAPEQEIRDRAETVDIAARVGGVAACRLFRRQYAGVPATVPSFRPCVRRFDVFHQPIEQLVHVVEPRALAHDDVRRLDVAVHSAPCRALVQRGDICRRNDRARGGQRTVLVPVLERQTGKYSLNSRKSRRRHVPYRRSRPCSNAPDAPFLHLAPNRSRSRVGTRSGRSSFTAKGCFSTRAPRYTCQFARARGRVRRYCPAARVLHRPREGLHGRAKDRTTEPTVSDHRIHQTRRHLRRADTPSAGVSDEASSCDADHREDNRGAALPCVLGSAFHSRHNHQRSVTGSSRVARCQHRMALGPSAMPDAVRSMK